MSEDTDLTNVVPPHELWMRRVDKTIQLYEYGAKSQLELITDLSRMGFDEGDINEVLEGEM